MAKGGKWWLVENGSTAAMKTPIEFGQILRA
jgi:hypothetical protein